MDGKLQIQYRDAGPEDVDAMRSLIFEHGPNPWNYLPEDGVNQHMDKIQDGSEWAVTAWIGPELIGFVSFRVGRIFPQYEPEGAPDADHAYIVEGVVHRDHAGSGIGSILIGAAKTRIKDRGIRTLYADRHEENIGSAALMQATGFEIIDTFPEPDRRPHGSGRTCVGRCTLD